MASGFDGTIRIDSRIDSKGFNKGISAMANSLKGLAAAIGVAFGVGAVVNFGRTAVAAAGDMASALTGLQSVLDGTGKSFAQARSFIDDFIADGLVPATNAINAYKNLALRGYDTKQIETTLLALKDSAAFGRQAHLSLGEAVQSATEGLKNENSILVDNAGVTKNVAKMWQDYAKSIGVAVTSLTKEQKIQAEVNGILQETRFQTGDAAKLTGGWAGMVARLSTTFQKFRVAVGNALIPLLSRIVPIIIRVVEWLTVLANTFGQVMGAIFGTQMNQAAASASAAADAQGELADQTERAEKAAKGSLAAFDELNVLQENSAENIDAGEPALPGIVPPGGDIVPPEVDSRIQQFVTRLKELLQPATDALGRLREALAPLGQTIWEGLKWAWDNILVPLGQWVITDALPVFLELLAAGAEVLNEALIALQPLGQWLWENFLQPLAEWTGGAIVDVLGWLADRLNDISDWISTNKKTVETIAIIVGSFAAAWWLVNAAITAWTVIAGVASVATAAFGAAVAFLTSPVFLVTLAIGALIAIIVLLVKNWDWVKETAGKVWDWIVEKWGQAGEWFRQNVTEPVKKWFEQAWANIKTAATNAWNWLVSVWTGAGEWIKSKVTDPVKNAFKIALEWIEGKFDTIFTAVTTLAKNKINTVIDFINGMIRAVAEGVNAVIGALNNLNITIPDWIPIYGGRSWGLRLPYVDAPQIPRLATGAVIPPNSEFLAILGDQKSGRNIEAPEGLIRQIIQEELGKIEADIRIEFGGSLGALVRELKPIIDKETVRIGKSLVQGI